MKNVIQRTLSGIVYLIIMIGSLLAGKYVFGPVLMLIGILALMEFNDVLGNGWNLSTRLCLFLAGVIFVLSFLVASHMADPMWLSILVMAPFICFIVVLYMKRQDALALGAKSILGLLYVVAPLIFMYYLVFPDVTLNHYTYRVVLGILILVWINDTGAYVFGITLGKHKLFPRISPKKSWEGLMGGTLVTLLASFLMEGWMGILTKTDWLILAGIVSVFGVYGDLVESFIKRHFDKKDSGSLIPGHGGVLDRIDSILLVMPAAYIYMKLNGL